MPGELVAQERGRAEAEDGRPDGFAVFVHLDPAAEPDDLLIALLGPLDDSPIRTARLLPEQIGLLTGHPQVRHLRLSAPLRTADEP